MNKRTLLRRTMAWSALAAATPAAAACGPLGGASNEPAREAGPPATVRWAPGGGAAAVPFFEEVTRRFNAKYGPKITAVAEPLPGVSNREAFEKYVTMAVAGQLPDIVELCCTWIRPFMLKGVVFDLNPLVRKHWKPAETDDFYKGPYESLRVDGKQYGLPTSMNMNVMFVNKNHLREANLPLPTADWTLSQFLDYAIKLTRRTTAASAGVGEAPTLEEGGRWGFDMPFHSLDRNATWIWAHGGEPHDPKDAGPESTRLTYDAPKSVEALQFLHDLIWRHHVGPATNAQRGGMNRDDAFMNGKSAILFQNAGSAGAISAGAPAAGLDWDFLPLVKGPGGHGSRHSIRGLVIDRQTKIPDAAWTVLSEVTSSEGQVLNAQLTGGQPARKSSTLAWQQLYPGKNTAFLRATSETARPDPRALWKDADVVGPIVENTYFQASYERNALPVQEAVRRAMADVRAHYAGRR